MNDELSEIVWEFVNDLRESDARPGYMNVNAEKTVEQAKQQLQALIDRKVREARIEECEQVMAIPGNMFVGNGTHEIHWQTGNRLATLKQFQRADTSDKFYKGA